MFEGYFGKILWIDLSSEKISVQEISEEMIRQYIGGYGLACRLIYENNRPKKDALSPDSLLGFFPGLLTATPAPLSGRYMVAGKSPLTNTWGDANSGGTFGPEIKKCGFDGILIKGTAQSPKYISIFDNNIEISDASKLWGLDIIEAENKLKTQHGIFIKTAGIGKAGEKLSRISGIANDRGRIAARSGLGAIMGAKKLKMLVLKGKNQVKYHDKELFLNLVKEYYKENNPKNISSFEKQFFGKFMNMVKTLRRLKIGMNASAKIKRGISRNFGTCSGNTYCAEVGDSPIKNWSGIGMYDFNYDRTRDISAFEINKFKIREYGCFSCPVQCGAILKIPELNLEETHLPEYETCSAFGSLLMNSDLLSIIEINEMCNRAAIDTISTGSTVAFAIECFEKNLITKDDTNGLELQWGNSKAIVELVKMIIERRGIGDILADGSKKASELIGKNSKQYAITSLGSELPMHNPKFINSLGFSYAYDPTPGRHTTASIDYMEAGPFDDFEKKLMFPKKRKSDYHQKIKSQIIATGFHQVLCASGLCMMAPQFGYYPFLDLINALTGWEMDIDECIKIGIRIQTLRQAFTLREGVDIAKNVLPGRSIGDPIDERGPTKGVKVKYEQFYKDYCKEIGWNPDNGYPLERTLKNLDLDFVRKDLYGEN
ncbi:MAG: hypothetical protein EAX91_12150 [Candidatus Lokiarchaeota archaeon]|nr:hypothetical protein [Candidatus Lokiarchaeota archaeon]